MRNFKYKAPHMLTVSGYVHVGNNMVDVEFKAYSDGSDDFDEVTYTSGMNSGKSVGEAIVEANRDLLCEAAGKAFDDHRERTLDSWEAQREDCWEARHDF